MTIIQHPNQLIFQRLPKGDSALLKGKICIEVFGLNWLWRRNIRNSEINYRNFITIAKINAKELKKHL